MSKESDWWRQDASAQDGVQHGLKPEEYERVVGLLDRKLNFVELGIISALYSEHCSYKSTKAHLRNLPTTGERVIQGPGENAGVVDIGDGEAVVFKVESHNHPTFIEPFQGAATGVGGILRDVFTMGARPLALLNSLRFGSLELPKSRYLLSRAVKGIGTYGNCVGVPTVGGETFFHTAYDGNCLVNAFALGLVDHDKVFYGNASGVGNSVLYVGSLTGRDGIHGATMASEEFNEDSEEKRPTVQVGDPFQEKLLIEACLEAMQTGAIVGIQDMGAAGLTSSAFEMAERSKTGVRLDLDKVPMREEGMNPYELMLSESQERMLLVVESGREDEVRKVVERWELSAVKIGEVVEGTDVELYWHGELVSSMPVEVVTSSVPVYHWPESVPANFEARQEDQSERIAEPEDVGETLLKLLESPNLASRFPLYSQYDSTVRTNTVVHPGSDSGVIRIKGRHKGVAIALDCNSRYCAIDPRLGAAHSVAEGVRNLAAVGARPIGLSNCLNYGSPEKPEGMWQIAEGIRGISEAARAFEAPVVSGNVSLYNETRGSAILPTPTIATVGLVKDASKCVAKNFRDAGDKIFFVGRTNEREVGGSEYAAWIAGLETGMLPVLDYDAERKAAEQVVTLIENGLLKSAHDVSQGGFGVAFAECCLGDYKSIGASVELKDSFERADLWLFAESGSRYIISCSAENEERVRSELEKSELHIAAEGEVGGELISVNGVVELLLSQAERLWKNGLKVYFDQV